MPAEFGHRHTVYDRFNRGNERGLWEKVLMALQKGHGPRSNEVIIGTMKVHRHGGGGQKGASEQRRVPSGHKHEVSPCADRMRAAGLRVFERGNVNDITVAAELVRDVAGCFVIGDRGYDSDKFRGELLSGNNVAVIPGRKSRKKAVEYDEKRYEKSDMNFLGFIMFAFMKIFLC